MDEDRMESLFEEALSLPLESRDAFLREQCGDNAELLARLRRMLEPDRTGELSALVDLARQSTELLEERPEASPSEGESIGPYKILRSIGAGTYGEVFLAEQTEKVQRLVAVKVLHAGMNSAEVVRRFHAERQSLARMDHPNIAKVYDAGVTDRGLPYFVMQYVPGEPITEYCDSRRLTVEERLLLFATVCEAVEHAHIKSVVHRDLKPSNVLVTSTDGGGPEPMVIDFGVAKVIEEGERDGTLHRTEEGRALGTWAYMSPEQASGDPDVDTRSDVYSLGVMLYELLCGSKPFEGETLRKAAEDEVRRMIREDEPPSPSDRLRSDGTAEASAVARRTGVSELSRRLRKELGLIPLFAMRKARDRRYQRAADLAEDVRSYLAGRAILAVPESGFYLARVFARQHRVLVSTVAATIASLALGVVGFAVQSGRTEQQRVRANERATAALTAEAAERRRAGDLEELSRFQAKMLRGLSASDAGVWLRRSLRQQAGRRLSEEPIGEKDGGRVPSSVMDPLESVDQLLDRLDTTALVSDLIDQALLQPAVDAVDERFESSPDLAAALRRTLGQAYVAIAKYAEARSLLSKSAEHYARSYGESDTRSIGATISLAQAEHGLGEQVEATATLRKCEAMVDELGMNPDVSVAAVQLQLGAALIDLGVFDRATRLLVDANARLKDFLGPTAEQSLEAKYQLAKLHARQGKPASGVELRELLFQVSEPGISNSIRNYLAPNISALLADQSPASLNPPRYRDAENILAIRSTEYQQETRVLGATHLVTLATAQDLCYSLVMSQRYSEATELVESSGVALRSQLSLSNPLCVVNKALSGMIHGYQGDSALGISIVTAAVDEFDEETLTSRRWKAIALDFLGAILGAEGRLVEAVVRLQDAARLYRDPTMNAMSAYVRVVALSSGVLLQLGRSTEAQESAQLAVNRARLLPEQGTDEQIRALRVLAMCFESTLLHDKALPIARELVELRRKSDPRNDEEFVKELGFLVATLRQCSRFAEVIATGDELCSLPTAAPPASYDGLALRFVIAESKYRLDRFDGLREELADIITGYQKAQPGKQGLLSKARELLRLVEKRPVTPTSAR